MVVGPGLGDGDAARECLQILHACQLPMVVDASALRREFLDDRNNANTVITPHPGEAAGLLDSSTAAVQADRLSACRELVDRFGAACVLKGSGTLIGQDTRIAVNLRGNPGMATAGMGDVLAGMAGAYLGQGLDAFDTACTAVFLHACAADLFALERDQTGLMASDVIDLIPRVVRQFRDAG